MNPALMLIKVHCSSHVKVAPICLDINTWISINNLFGIVNKKENKYLPNWLSVQVVMDQIAIIMCMVKSCSNHNGHDIMT